MFKLDGMLMIGSAESNVGKTELACSLLEKLSQCCDLTGIKVTLIRNRNVHYSGEGEGCSVCSSLEGVYHITEEFNRHSKKDTARLLAAGASRVFWLQVVKEHLSEGMIALLDIIGKDAISICESNSLREIAEPGLFLMVKKSHSEGWKTSAQCVKKYADRIVISNGKSFNFDLDKITLIHNTWILRADATAIIMAGGSSRRMGTDKSMLIIDGQPIIERTCKKLSTCFEQILISANKAEKFTFLGFPIVSDKVPEQGPLMGIASALEASAHEINFVVACDIPDIKWHDINQMLARTDESRADIVVPKTCKDKYEPLFAVYRKSALKAINKTLSSGKRKITDAFDVCTVEYIELDNTNGLLNLNTMTDYEEYQKIHGDEVR